MINTPIRIERIAAGGDGVARHEGKVLFVPGTAPGDEVEVEIVQTGKSFDRGRAVRILVRGPDRIEPPCRYAADCGGCPLMHLDYDAQLRVKAEIVRDALQRIGKVPVEEIPIRRSPEQWGYRDRIRLHRSAEGLGYHRAGSHEILPIEECLIAAPELNTRLREPIPDDGAAACELRLEDGQVQVIALEGREPPAFRQVNPAGNRLLVERILTLMAPSDSILELFCGNGNFTLPLLAAGKRVIAVDGHRPSVKKLQKLGETEGFDERLLTKKIDLHGKSAGTYLTEVGEVEAALLDPPRSGAKVMARFLAERGPGRIVYVSCDPATLARDVRVLVQGGYRLMGAEAIDLFPQTAHVETIVELEREG